MTVTVKYSQCPLLEKATTTSHFNVCRYDTTTGVFTVPPGGDGVYFFSVFVRVDAGETGGFHIKLNDDVMCTTYPDHNSSGDLDYAHGSCSAVVDAVAGDV